jgi:hypothetical protein
MLYLISQFTFPRGSPVSANIDQFWLDYEHKRCFAGSQRLIMAVVYKARADTILKEFPRNSSDRARLTSVTNPYSGSWLTTAPLDPLFTLHDIHFALATRLRLGLPLFDNITRCVCGATLDHSPLHFMACRNLSRIPRHDRLVQVITRVARLCGVTTQIEPRIDGEDKSRGDGHLFFHAQSGIFDTLVIDPCANSYRKAAQHPLGAASIGEKRKSDSYDARCRQQGFLFYPVVIETFGGLGVRCRDLVSKIAEEGSLNGVTNIHGIGVKPYLLRAISFSLQSGNALLAIQGSQRAKKRLLVE